MKIAVATFIIFFFSSVYASPDFGACAFKLKPSVLNLDDNKKVVVTGTPISNIDIDDDFFEQHSSLCPEPGQEIIIKLRASRNNEEFEELQKQKFLQIIYVQVDHLYFEGKLISNSHYEIMKDE